MGLDDGIANQLVPVLFQRLQHDNIICSGKTKCDSESWSKSRNEKEHKFQLNIMTKLMQWIQINQLVRLTGNECNLGTEK